MNTYHIFWGETHDNTYQFEQQSTPIEEVIRRAASHLDFYAAAYYTATAAAFEEGGHQTEKESGGDLILEGWKDRERLEQEWQEVQEATRELYQPGSFVTFPGYEWQGDGSSGDHNVFAFQEGLPIFRVNTLQELYGALQEYKALAIPHHTGYLPGRRGRDWSVLDETISPFAEVFSVHGCSETDEEWIGLRKNFYMGPGLGGGTYQEALERGYHVGAICSTDNWGDMPGHYGNGRMACLAEECTREGLWEAFTSRRVYGVTGDRIELDFRVDDAVMGSIIDVQGPRHIYVHVTGSDALDRIEILKNGRVIQTYCHQGTWDVPEPGVTSRFKMRVEAGWGPRPGDLALPDRQWDGELLLGSGLFLGYEPCWISSGQSPAHWEGGKAQFQLTSSGSRVTEFYQNSNVFEFEGDSSDTVTVRLNGKQLRKTVGELARSSNLFWYKDECIRNLKEYAGIEPGTPEREDIYYMYAHKAKIHRVIPEAGYTATVKITDDEPLTEETHYRVRVEQRNGQRAWSSPIWVQP